MGIYPKPKQEKGKAKAVLKHHRVADKPVDVARKLPGNVILVHGVNDLGTSYAAIEEGLCEGLSDRLNRTFQAAKYKLPGIADKDQVLDDPDAIFYRRQPENSTDSPIIPFYWGYREIKIQTKTVRGQNTDRYGNRLDKDLAKGGGPFANATSTLPDMWNKGFGTIADPSGDPIRPLLDAPGRLYMVLAAQRLAALISIIRDYDEDETVSIVAHSQGCLVSLLAQAILAEKGLRPADTLILTHPPYSLTDEPSHYLTSAAAHLSGGEDEAMKPFYSLIQGSQSLHGRLRTLVNIVQCVAKRKPSATDPQFSTLADHKQHDGIVGGLWKAEADRDNRGKVYLYFCPLDMTVALDNIQGIGWQGVPDLVSGSHWDMVPERVKYRGQLRIPTGRIVEQKFDTPIEALKALGARFYQRVFTDRLRLDPATAKIGPVLVGRPPSYDYALRLKGEDDRAHVASANRTFRTDFPEARWPINPHDDYATQRNGIRTITGEALRTPAKAVLGNTNETAAQNIPKASIQATRKTADSGPCEDVDPIDAQIAVTSNRGMQSHKEQRDDPRVKTKKSSDEDIEGQGLPASAADLATMTTSYNKEKRLEGGDQRTITAASYFDGKFIATIEQSPNEARRRWQHELSPKSFHGSIIGNKENHRQVTAYDIAIGKGTASSDPEFHAYLCAVADWRLKKPQKNEIPRPNILLWPVFLNRFQTYLDAEPAWRYEIIEGNLDYYSSGVLPNCLPLLTGKLWEIIISRTVNGERVPPNQGSKS